ncbi:Hypothetical predicted protein, partial [Olea europaea subsp. europaea]
MSGRHGAQEKERCTESGAMAPTHGARLTAPFFLLGAMAPRPLMAPWCPPPFFSHF